MSKEEIIIQELKHEMEVMKDKVREHPNPDFICGYITAIMTLERRLKELEDIND
jgi:hypothetical protein